MLNSTGRTFKLEDFEGPLDLLLFLIKKNDVNIYNIPIAEITEQYLEYLRSADILDLDDASEFYVMASHLLYIKSHTLLPVTVEFDDSEDPREGLVEKLIEYQKFKKLSELMGEREEELTLERKNPHRNLPSLDSADSRLWRKMDIQDLFKTFSALMANISAERIIDLYEEVSVNEKIALLIEILEERKECSFTDIIVHKNSVMDIVCAFIAVLEAVKIRMILIFQNTVFGEIRIMKNNEPTVSTD